MIYVFKTTVRTKKQILKLKPHIDKLLPNSIWNFDLEDCDNILRIDSVSEIAQPTIKILKDNGFDCQELED
jgi:hypothetical protein